MRGVWSANPQARSRRLFFMLFSRSPERIVAPALVAGIDHAYVVPAGSYRGYLAVLRRMPTGAAPADFLVNVEPEPQAELRSVVLDVADAVDVQLGSIEL